MGCPTANIEMTEENQRLTMDLIPGVYLASAQFIHSPNEKYKAALTIGWNPVYENLEKTIEVFIMNDFKG